MTIGINSVTQVSITIASGATTGTATVNSPVGTYFLMFQGASTTATTSNAQGFARISISGTTVTATRNTSSTNVCVVNATLVDADSSLVASVQMGTITISAGTSNTATISSVTTTNSAVHMLGFIQSLTSFHFDLNTPVLALTNSTTVTATLINGRSGTVVVGYLVVEFQGSALNQSTQPFATTWTNTLGSTVQVITSVNTNNAMIFYAGGGSSNGDVGADEQQRVQLTSAINATISAGNATGDAMQVNFTVVEFVSGVLSQNAQRGTTTIAASTSSKTDTVTSADTTASLLNLTGWTTTTTVTTSLANILPRITQTDATDITATVGGTVPASKNTIAGWELLTFTKMGGSTPIITYISDWFG